MEVSIFEGGKRVACVRSYMAMRKYCGTDIVQLQKFLKLSRIGFHHEVNDMRQRATFRELIPKPVRHAVQDAKRARIPVSYTHLKNYFV